MNNGTATYTPPGTSPNPGTYRRPGSGTVVTAESPIPQQWWEQDAAAASSAMQPPSARANAVPASSYNPFPHSHPEPTNQTNTTTPTPSRYHRPADFGTQSREDPVRNFPPSVTNERPTSPPTGPVPPSSTGLIRLTLRKPMGIVFEPMPAGPTGQSRGVRICDLPRTGAAALSRKLEVGDELLSINDKTMSRLTFDEIMDFIIEADPERVNLLFRRPRKEAVATNKKNLPSLKFSASAGAGNSVKWVDDHPKKDKERERREKERREKESAGERVKGKVDDNAKSKKTGKGRGGKQEPWESESFLDMLIDSLCSPILPSNDMGCKKNEDEYSDDGTYLSGDDSTYVTYEESLQEIDQTQNKKKKGSAREAQKNSKYDDETVDNETIEDEHTLDDTVTLEVNEENDDVHQKPISSRHQVQNRQRIDQDSTRSPKEEENEFIVAEQQLAYEDDATLETVGTLERQKEQLKTTQNQKERSENPYQYPLGLAPPKPPENPPIQKLLESTATKHIPLPIEELEYDDQVDGGEVSVITSSLAADNFGYPSALMYGMATYSAEPGMTVEDTIEKSPQRFYRHVVKHLLETHEPEKARLLDKLMTKYTGREEHLIQKLTLRYNKQQGKQGGNLSNPPTIKEDQSYSEYDNDESEQEYKLETYSDIQNTVSTVTTASLGSLATKKDESTNKGLSAKKNRKMAATEDPFSPALDQKEDWPPVINEEEEEITVATSKSSIKSLEELSVALKQPIATPKSQEPEPEPSFPSEEENLPTPDMSAQLPRKSRSPSPPTSPASSQKSQRRTTEDENNSIRSGSYASSSPSYSSSIDGTSPAIIAQVSELLNFVYGKTSVPGQIDRVSTIMRAYEGREAVLLELLETKALIKANSQKDQESAISSPLSISGPDIMNEQHFHNEHSLPGDDISSVTDSSIRYHKGAPNRSIASQSRETVSKIPEKPVSSSSRYENTSKAPKKKKDRKGFFGMFSSKKSKKKPQERSEKSPQKSVGLLSRQDSEASI